MKILTRTHLKPPPSKSAVGTALVSAYAKVVAGVACAGASRPSGNVSTLRRTTPLDPTLGSGALSTGRVVAMLTTSPGGGFESLEAVIL